MGEQILGGGAEPPDRFAFKESGEILHQRPAQIAAVRDDFDEARSLHNRLEPPAHSLDLGQFGHRYVPLSYRQPQGRAALSSSEPRLRFVAPGRVLAMTAKAPVRHIASSTLPRYGLASKGLSAMPPARDQTHFGFREVPLERKQAMVDDVFHSVAGRYDLMNDLMSGGLHRAWKDALVTAVNPPRAQTAAAGEGKAPARPFALLDLSSGTGDISLRR